MQGRLAARGRPVRRQRDVHARSLGGRHVGGVTVEQQVGQGRPDEAGADLAHLLEFRGRQGGPVDEDQLSDQRSLATRMSNSARLDSSTPSPR